MCFDKEIILYFHLIAIHCSDYDMPSPDFGVAYDDVLEEDSALICDSEELETINKAKSDSLSPLLLKCRLFSGYVFFLSRLIFRI